MTYRRGHLILPTYLHVDEGRLRTLRRTANLPVHHQLAGSPGLQPAHRTATDRGAISATEGRQSHMSDHRLEIDHVSKRYGDLVALREMTFDVRPGPPRSCTTRRSWPWKSRSPALTYWPPKRFPG
jgi:hypothetical protein